jgi:hypothetical protein
MGAAPSLTAPLDGPASPPCPPLAPLIASLRAVPRKRESPAHTDTEWDSATWQWVLLAPHIRSTSLARHRGACSAAMSSVPAFRTGAGCWVLGTSGMSEMRKRGRNAEDPERVCHRLLVLVSVWTGSLVRHQTLLPSCAHPSRRHIHHPPITSATRIRMYCSCSQHSLAIYTRPTADGQADNVWSMLCM